MIFAQLLKRSRDRDADKTALVFADKAWSYAELDDTSDHVAANLAAAGVQRNDRVAFFMPNCAELVLSYIACFKLGAIAVPLNHRYLKPEAEYALSHSGSTTLLLHADKLADAQDLPYDSLGIARVYLIAGKPDKARYKPYAELLSPPKSPLPPPKFSERQLATIMYTSGTTAQPKGVVHSQQTLSASAAIQAATMQFTPEDVQLVTTSASHCAASYGQLFPNFLVGGTAVMLDGPTPKQVVEAIERYRVTRCQMLPAGLQDFVEYAETHKADLSSLRSFFSGGDVVPLDTHHRFKAVLGWDVSEVCGMTETVTYTTNPPFGQKKLGSVGKPMVDTEVRIVDGAGNPLPVDTVGEIEIRAAANMVGYWNDTLSTAATFDNGWLASGDLGRLDADGFLWFVGRKKEIIIRGGSNISPAEVEEVIDQHPAVHLSGVIGQSDPHWGQIVVAFVALRPDVPAPSEKELREFVAQRISAYKVPERFIFMRDLPLSPTGKVDRKQLHARLDSGEFVEK